MSLLGCPSPNPIEGMVTTMDDLISRAEAMRTYQNVCYEISCDECKAKEEDGTCRFEKWVRTLPTATRSTDEWCTDCSEYDTERKCCPRFNRVIRTALDDAQRWIPIKTRPMTEEERQHWEEYYGMRFDDEDATIFDCPMPEDGQCVWLTTKNGYLFQDVVENDDGMIGLEGNDDWYDIIAWMPVYKPEPYKPPKEET